MNLFEKILATLSQKSVQQGEEHILAAKLDNTSVPFYIKSPMIIIGLIATFYVLHLLGDILVPIAFSILVAILLNPFYNKLIRIKIPKVIAILIVLLTSMLIVSCLVLFIASQLENFSTMLPVLKEKYITLYNDFTIFIKDHLKISIYKQEEFLKKTMSNAQTYVGSTITSIFDIITLLVLIPLYVFLLLYYKPLLLNFIYECFDDKDGDQVEEILTETKSAVQTYILGLMIELVIVAVMNSALLLILDVDYAILLGIIGAILNLIPYLGGIIAIALPILIATVTKDGYTTQLMILLGYTVIQFIDNNIIIPKVVSSKVSVNAFISIIIVLLGNMLWGVSGMFLSIPFVAVLKIIFDRIEELKPWGKLIGDQLPCKKSPIQERNHQPASENAN